MDCIKRCRILQRIRIHGKGNDEFDAMALTSDKLIESWRTVFENEMKESSKYPWVLFKEGTIVIVEDTSATDKDSIKAKATETMKSMGPVIAGTPHGDFNLFDVDSVNGIVVTGHCDQMFTLVKQKKNSNAMMLGLEGRSLRHADSQSAQIIHIEIK